MRSLQAFVWQKEVRGVLRRDTGFDDTWKNHWRRYAGRRYGGRKEIMSCVAPLGEVYQAGTLSGNPIAMTAGIETLKILRDSDTIYETIEKKAEKLAAVMRETFGETVCVNQVGSLMSLFFTGEKVVDYDTVQTSDTNRYSAYFKAMLKEGIYLAPSQFEAMFVSAAHTDKDIERHVSRLESLPIRSRLGGIRWQNR